MKSKVNDEVLSLALRPKKLSDLIGQKRAVHQIVNQMASKREPRSWMFSGQPGGGKTSAAQITALALQQIPSSSKIWGEHTDADWEKWDDYQINETNCSDKTGIDEIRKMVEYAQYMPAAGSRRRIFILNEAHRISPQAQDLLLEPTEVGPRTTTWMIVTSELHKIRPALRRRCFQVRLDPLGSDDIRKLLFRAKAFSGYTGKVGRFAERMVALGINSPGVITAEFEQHILDAALPTGLVDSRVEPISVARLFTLGNWGALAKTLQKTTPDSARELQIVIIGYLRSMLLNGCQRSGAVAEAMFDLSNAPMIDGLPLLSWLTAVLYKHVRSFR